jgi:hypothetical protein
MYRTKYMINCRIKDLIQSIILFFYIAYDKRIREQKNVSLIEIKHLDQLN